MGNRAVITMEDSPNALGIYLHWNGGRDSVEAFLTAAKKLGLREGDDSYGMARLTQIIGNALGGTLSLGLGILSHLDCDNGDNGLYIISDKFEIVGRKYHSGGEQGATPEKAEKLLAWVMEANAAPFKEKA